MSKKDKAAKPPKAKKVKHIGEERISLRHLFDDKEYREIGGRLNLALNTLGQLETDLAAISKDYKARIAQQEGIRDELNNKLGCGYEMRTTPVTAVYEPAKRIKTYYLLDDKKRKNPLNTVEMQPSDFQLDWLEKPDAKKPDGTPPATATTTGEPPANPANPASTNVGEAIAEAEKAADTKKLREDAIEVIRSEGKASVALIQRRLKIGYGTATAIAYQLEQEGVIGPAEGDKPRAILNLPPATPASGTPQHDTANPPPVPAKKASKRKPTKAQFQAQQDNKGEGDK